MVDLTLPFGADSLLLQPCLEFRHRVRKRDATDCGQIPQLDQVEPTSASLHITQMGLGKAQLRRYVGLGKTRLQTHFSDHFDENCVLRAIDGLWHGRVYEKSGFQSYIALPYIGTLDIVKTHPKRSDEMVVLRSCMYGPCLMGCCSGLGRLQQLQIRLGAPRAGWGRRGRFQRFKASHAKIALANVAPLIAPHVDNLRTRVPSITPTSPNHQLQLTPSFAPAATPCEFHPTSAHPPHSISHHRECCPSARLTLSHPVSMVHA